ncbi:MAG: hypothetical protein IPO58_17315 [Betaproteobacteria bacterium]|nr:hypothetical protein [Betaproteobacteria bacterium]
MNALIDPDRRFADDHLDAFRWYFGPDGEFIARFAGCQMQPVVQFDERAPGGGIDAPAGNDACPRPCARCRGEDGGPAEQERIGPEEDGARQRVVHGLRGQHEMDTHRREPACGKAQSDVPPPPGIAHRCPCSRVLQSLASNRDRTVASPVPAFRPVDAATAPLKRYFFSSSNFSAAPFMQ